MGAMTIMTSRRQPEKVKEKEKAKVKAKVKVRVKVKVKTALLDHQKVKARAKARERAKEKAKERARTAQRANVKVRAKVAPKVRAKARVKERVKERASPRGRWRMKPNSMGWYGSFDQAFDRVFVRTRQCLQQPSLETTFRLRLSGATLACFSREREAMLICLYVVKQRLQCCGCAQR